MTFHILWCDYCTFPHCDIDAEILYMILCSPNYLHSLTEHIELNIHLKKKNDSYVFKCFFTDILSKTQKEWYCSLLRCVSCACWYCNDDKTTTYSANLHLTASLETVFFKAPLAFKNIPLQIAKIICSLKLGLHNMRKLCDNIVECRDK